MTNPTATRSMRAAHRASVPGVRAWRRPAILVLVACLALALGVIVYLTDRDAARSMLMPDSAALAGGNVFGVLGQWLPSFVHPLAFSLLTAAVLAPRSTPRYGACVAWGAINVAFEVGQHPLVSPRLAEALTGPLDGLPLVEPLARYFIHGTFDWGDIAAALLGALIAGVVLRFISCSREQEHAQ
jgi:hypothetical protein